MFGFVPDLTRREAPTVESLYGPMSYQRTYETHATIQGPLRAGALVTLPDGDSETPFTPDVVKQLNEVWLAEIVAVRDGSCSLLEAGGVDRDFGLRPSEIDFAPEVVSRRKRWLQIVVSERMGNGPHVLNYDDVEATLTLDEGILPCLGPTNFCSPMVSGGLFAIGLESSQVVAAEVFSASILSPVARLVRSFPDDGRLLRWDILSARPTSVVVASTNALLAYDLSVDGLPDDGIPEIVPFARCPNPKAGLTNDAVAFVSRCNQLVGVGRSGLFHRYHFRPSGPDLLTCELPFLGGSLYDVCDLPNQLCIAIADKSMVHILDVRTFGEEVVVRGLPGYVMCVREFGDFGMISFSGDGDISLVDLRRPEDALFTKNVHPNVNASGVAYFKDVRYLGNKTFVSCAANFGRGDRSKTRQNVAIWELRPRTARVLVSRELLGAVSACYTGEPLWEPSQQRMRKEWYRVASRETEEE